MNIFAQIKSAKCNCMHSKSLNYRKFLSFLKKLDWIMLSFDSVKFDA